MSTLEVQVIQARSGQTANTMFRNVNNGNPFLNANSSHVTVGHPSIGSTFSPSSLTTTGTITTGGNIVPGTANTYTLGTSSAAFASAYLGSGVYIGGTTSANLLDDYEEGTWTPAYTSAGASAITVTYDIQVGHYVKVGNIIKATFRIRTDAVTGGSSDTLRVTGLPFSSANVSDMHYGAAIGRRVGWGNKPATAYVQTNDTYLLMVRDGSEASGTLTQTNDLATGTNDNDLNITVVYQTA